MPEARRQVSIKKRSDTETEEGNGSLPTFPMLFTGSVSSVVRDANTQTEEEVIKPESLALAQEDTKVEKTENIEIKKRRGRKPKPKPEVVKIPKRRGRKPKITTYTSGEGTPTPEQSYVTYSLIKTSSVDKEERRITPSSLFDNSTYIVTLKITEDEANHMLRNLKGSPEEEPWSMLPPEPCAPPLRSTHSEYTSGYHNQENPKITKELANFMEEHFNNMYSLPSKIPENYKLTMPKIIPEEANFVETNNYHEIRPLQTRLSSVEVNLDINGRWTNRKMSDILPAFKDRDEWPTESPYACWNCTEHFEGPPIGIPDYIEGEIDALDLDNIKFFLYGNFCWFSCAARYLFDTVKDASVWETYNLLNILHSKVFGLKSIEKVELAPWKVLLKKFGGPLSIEQYRDINRTSRLEYQIFKPPMIPVLYQLEESLNGREIIEKQDDPFIPIDTKRLEQKFKFDRFKPTKNKMTIDKCMNIRVKVV